MDNQIVNVWLRFKLGNLDVSFPYNAVYPEQYEYMSELVNLL